MKSLLFRYGIIGGIMSYIIFYVLLLIYDLITIPITKKNWRDVLAAAKPECFKPMAVLEQEGELDRAGGWGAHAVRCGLALAEDLELRRWWRQISRTMQMEVSKAKSLS